MSLFKKKVTMSIPDIYKDFPIEVDRSICTGEATVGFRDPVTKQLKMAELARNEEEVMAYIRKYGRTK